MQIFIAVFLAVVLGNLVGTLFGFIVMPRLVVRILDSKLPPKPARKPGSGRKPKPKADTPPQQATQPSLTLSSSEGA